jgi:outer membrane receptor protein involved in Fe transport
LLCFTGASALTSPAMANPLDSEWRWRAQAAVAHEFDTDLDTGGSVSQDRYFVSGGGSTAVGAKWRLGVNLGYGADRYDFSGATGLAGLRPWGTLREFRISTPVRYLASPDWSFFGIPSLRFDTESGVSLGEGVNGGLLAGASYRVSDSLRIGPGFGLFSEIEDDASLFPILLVDWAITDSLSLETGGGFAASRGPGLQLNWQHSPQWRFSVGGRYEKSRYRLDDEGPAPDGVAEVRSVPLYLQAQYNLSEAASLGFIGGAEVGGELKLEDSRGSSLNSSDIDPAPFLGITFRANL